MTLGLLIANINGQPFDIIPIIVWSGFFVHLRRWIYESYCLQNSLFISRRHRLCLRVQGLKVCLISIKRQLCHQAFSCSCDRCRWTLGRWHLDTDKSPKDTVIVCCISRYQAKTSDDLICLSLFKSKFLLFFLSVSNHFLPAYHLCSDLQFLIWYYFNVLP